MCSRCWWLPASVMVTEMSYRRKQWSIKHLLKSFQFMTYLSLGRHANKFFSIWAKSDNRRRCSCSFCVFNNLHENAIMRMATLIFWHIRIISVNNIPLCLKTSQSLPKFSGLTLAALPSITATQELVVPRSTPITAPFTPSDLYRTSILWASAVAVWADKILKLIKDIFCSSFKTWIAGQARKLSGGWDDGSAGLPRNRQHLKAGFGSENLKQLCRVRHSWPVYKHTPDSL